jgi:hypothetical protein
MAICERNWRRKMKWRNGEKQWRQNNRRRRRKKTAVGVMVKAQASAKIMAGNVAKIEAS